MARPRHPLTPALAVLVGTLGLAGCTAELDEGPEIGGPEIPVRYVGPPLPEPHRPDGGIRPVVGVSNIQVMRASPRLPELQDDYGYLYNHQPMLAYWKGQFYLEYLSAPREEVFNAPAGRDATGEEKPCHTVLTVSADGDTWSKPEVVFPAYELPDGAQTIAHQRMGFYVTPDDRLLILAFYGTPTGPNDGKGVGRVVREIHEDGSFGPIYFIRYNRHAGWDESNTPYPFYRASEDAGFVQGCEALLADKLVTQQWWEEDRGDDGFFAISGTEDYSGKGWETKFSAKALTYWHREDGRVVGIWKGALAALSDDEGQSWSRPVEAPGIAKTNAKHWGQRMDNGRYVLSYCPQDGWGNRWPLAVVTSDDGITFGDMLYVHGEIPIRRYPGHNKNLGAQYVRGVTEGNGDPPGDDLWLTYSVNKEDMWVSRVPVPVRFSVGAPVDDTFDDMASGGPVPDWNLYSPRWAPVAVAESPTGTNKSLRLEDRDPYDYARAQRVFPEGAQVDVALEVHAEQTDRGRLDVEVLDARGHRPVQVVLAEDGRILVGQPVLPGAGSETVEPAEAGSYRAGKWVSLHIEVDATAGTFTLTVDDEEPSGPWPFAERAASVERLSLRTGEHRPAPLEDEGKWQAGGIDPDTDHPIDAAVYYVDDVRTETRAGG